MIDSMLSTFKLIWIEKPQITSSYNQYSAQVTLLPHQVYRLTFIET